MWKIQLESSYAGYFPDQSDSHMVIVEVGEGWETRVLDVNVCG